MNQINEYRQQLLKKFKIDLNPVSAQGNQIQLQDGTIAYDYLAQYGALPFGHNPTFLKDVVKTFLDQDQVNFIQPNILPGVEAFAQKLTRTVHPHYYTRCITSNSGTETVEAALKVARIKTGRAKILTVYDGFHGKTYSALSASGSKRFKMPHIHDELNYDYIQLDDIEQLTEKLQSKQYAAFMVEPVLGEGGMRPASLAFLQQAVELCEQTQTMSIFDEIQTGMGRLGEICAAKLFNIYPDCILFSKALGGGIMPIGAVIYKERFHSFHIDKKHSSTFANNGLAASVATAVLDHLNDPTQQVYENVNRLSAYLDQSIQRLSLKYPHIIQFRGIGLMRSFEFFDPAAQQNILMHFCQNNGAMAYIMCGYLLRQHQIFMMPLLSQPCSIRFEPPLNISLADIDRFTQALTELCEIVNHGRYDILFGNLIELNKADFPDISQAYSVSHVENAQIAAIKYPEQQTELTAAKRFAFFIHTTSAEDLVHTFPYAIKQNFTTRQMMQLSDQIIDLARIDYSPDVGGFFTVYNNEHYADGMFIFSPLSPKDMMRLDKPDRLQLMKEYLEVAATHGAEIVGLGAYTSVISDGGNHLLPHANDLLITNGNSLTAMATVESLFSLTQDTDLSDACAVIVGARGSVGKIAVAGLAHRYGQLILVGRPGSEAVIEAEIIPYLIESCMQSEYPITDHSFFAKLQQYLQRTAIASLQIEQIVHDLYLLGLSIETDYQIAFSRADAVISATSEGKAFLNTQYLKRSALVFDAARPFDFVSDGHIKIYEGGLVKQPNPVFYSDCNMIQAPAGVNLACLSETIALALENVDQHQSIGRNISFNKACQILKIAKQQGFSAVNYASKQKVCS